MFKGFTMKLFNNDRFFKICLLFIFIFALILRLTWLDLYPPALYSDEVSQGYNSYSLLKTGRDEHGYAWPISFRAFGEWKPPLQTYLSIGTIALFGLNAWGVRLPSAILGATTIPLIYFFVLILFQRTKKYAANSSAEIKFIGLVTAMLLAISPWHILQSRSGMHGAIALFFLLSGMWAFLQGLTKSRWMYVSSFGFASAMYAYYGMQVVVPLTIILLGLGNWNTLIKLRTSLIAPIFFGLLLGLPLLIGIIKEPNVLFGRAHYVSIFYDKGVDLTIWDLATHDEGKFSPLATRVLHNKPYQYGTNIIKRAFEHLDSRFLFIVGDIHEPFQIPHMGVMYLIDAVFLCIGIWYIKKYTQNILPIILGFGIISIFPSALTFLTPASNRAFPLVVPLMIVTACGVVGCCKIFRSKLTRFIIFEMYFISFSFFIFQFTYVLPTFHANWWRYGYKELVQYLSSQETAHQSIVIAGNTGVPYIFLLFYRSIDPLIAQGQLVHNYTKDELGFEHVDRFKNYQFPRNFSWKNYEPQLKTGTLLVTLPTELVGESAKRVKDIVYPDGTVAYKIYLITKEQ